MQRELSSLRETVGAYKEGKLYIESKFTKFGPVKRVALPSEVVNALDQDLLDRIIRLEAKVSPEVAKKKLGWWHKVSKRLKNTDTHI
jgi:hypothetical protein